MKNRNTSKSEKSRIQIANEEKILSAATELFSRHSVGGTSLDQIAERAGLSKANILYYFSSKQNLYLAALNRLLELWLAPLDSLDPHGDPETELSNYLKVKMMLSRDYPEASRLFAFEVLEGAETLRQVLKTQLKTVFDYTSDVLQTWMDEGKIRKIDPAHLIFSMWAITQHYADFDAQIGMITGSGIADAAFFTHATDTITDLILHGCLKS